MDLTLKLAQIGNVTDDSNPDDRASILYERSKSICLEMDVAPVFFFLGVRPNGDKALEKIDLIFLASEYFDSDLNKNLCSNLIQASSFEIDPDAIAFISEAYMIKLESKEAQTDLDKEYHKLKEQFGVFKNIPGRKECLEMVVSHRGGRCYTVTSEIIRSENDKKTEVINTAQRDSDFETGGRFAIPRWDGVKETIH